MYRKRDFIVIGILFSVLPLIVFAVTLFRSYSKRAHEKKANIVVYSDRAIGPLPHTWEALSQGGEEKGVRMFANVIDSVSQLTPRYIRIDHVYDFYDVVNRTPDGLLQFNWTLLDQTICDIFATGAKPFFSLGYMPKDIAKDKLIINPPKKWEEWQEVVQKTIEHYSGKDMRICPNQKEDALDNIYYEVWNEPDLESFGKWNIHGGERDYKTLYYFAAKGAEQAVNVRPFFFGGPATTAAYQNWFQLLIQYAKAYHLRLDFLSWHHYGMAVNQFSNDMKSIDFWLSTEEYENYRDLPRIISEWGIDSEVNQLSETTIAAAHTVAAIRYLIEEDLEMAFAFEIKDGLTQSWGIITHDGKKKPRYHALRLLSNLGTVKLKTEGEGSFVKAIASRQLDTITVVLVNYDSKNQHQEIIPFSVRNLKKGKYTISREWLNGQKDIFPFSLSTTYGQYSELVSMKPNSVVVFTIKKL